LKYTARKPKTFRYTQEQKEEALRLYTEKRHTACQIAGLTGVKYETVRNWVAQARADLKSSAPVASATKAAPLNAPISAETSIAYARSDEEWEKLQAENRRLRRERDIFKAAAALFAQTHA
jgi:transposase-like protein